MKNLKKCKNHAFGKDIYLLGKDKNGTKYWLEAASFDCDWYWGFGYIKTYTNNSDPANSKDISSHQHFDDLFLENNIWDSFKDFFEKTTLNDEEIWQLLGYIQEFYTMQRYADLLYCGNHITPKAKNIKDDKNEKANIAEYNRINKILMPKLFAKIYKLLEK